MPLRVHCPEGCLIRVPSTRAGSIVRCPKCKSIIRLSQPSETELASGKPIPMRATLVRQAKNTEILDATPYLEEPAEAESAVADANSKTKVASEQKPRPKAAAQQPKRKKRRSKKVAEPNKAAPTQKQKSDVVGKQKPVEQNSEPVNDQTSMQGVENEESKVLSELDTDLSELKPNNLESIKPRLVVPRPQKTNPSSTDASESKKPNDPVVSESSDSGSEPTASSNEYAVIDEPGRKSDEVFLRRVKHATADRIVLTRFYAICLALVGLFNLIPAIYFWYHWGISDVDVSIAGADLPRWTYLQVFISALHFVYAVYLFQLPDWSALRTVAFTMLAFATLFGIVSTGLLVGGGQGNIAQFLNLPNVYVRNASIWCVAMLCLATLFSYLTGRESALWKRTEQLLQQILAQQA